MVLYAFVKSKSYNANYILNMKKLLKVHVLKYKHYTSANYWPIVFVKDQISRTGARMGRRNYLFFHTKKKGWFWYAFETSLTDS